MHTALAPLFRRVAALTSRLVRMRVDERLTAALDADLIEQALVNPLLQRAIPARPEVDHRLWNGPLEVHLLRYRLR